MIRLQLWATSRHHQAALCCARADVGMFCRTLHMLHFHRRCCFPVPAHTVWQTPHHLAATHLGTQHVCWQHTPQPLDHHVLFKSPIPLKRNSGYGCQHRPILHHHQTACACRSLLVASISRHAPCTSPSSWHRRRVVGTLQTVRSLAACTASTSSTSSLVAHPAWCTCHTTTPWLVRICCCLTRGGVVIG